MHPFKFMQYMCANTCVKYTYNNEHIHKTILAFGYRHKHIHISVQLLL